MTDNAVSNVPEAPSVTAPAKQDSWERFVDDVSERPLHYVTMLLVGGVVLAAILIGKDMFTSSKESKLDDVARALEGSVRGTKPPEERILILKEVATKTAGTPTEAARLFALACAQRDLAEESLDGKAKLDAWKECAATCGLLKTSFAASVWNKFPSRPPLGAGSESGKTAVELLAEHATAQAAFLEKHPFTSAAKADPGLKATIELDNGAKIVIDEFYSAATPFHVANFVKLAKDGYYPGTTFGSFRKGNQKPAPGQAPTQTAVNIGLEFGDPMSKVTPDNRDDDGTQDIGYSIRDEANSLPFRPGTIVSVQDWSAGGDSASRLAVYVDEPVYGYGTPFARVTDEASLKVLRDLLASEADTTNAVRLKTPIKIKSITIEGAIANPPETAFPPAFKMPESQPAKR